MRRVAAARSAVSTCLFPMDVISGAGHDAVYLARVTPGKTIFVP
ncbi:hypothetical protein QFZ94_002034 [Paraburkholderia sp. JPY465]